jgi:hypothetical protein
MSCVHSYNFFCPILILDIPFTCGRDYMYFLPCSVPHVKLGNRETISSKRKFRYVVKWLSNEHINQKLFNHFWKDDKIPDTQITQTLKFRYAQHMGNHRKNIFGPLKYQNPNCTLCRTNDRDTWPHLLSTCEHPYLKGLRIARHNKAAHLIAHTLQGDNKTKQFQIGFLNVYARKNHANAKPN